MATPVNGNAAPFPYTLRNLPLAARLTLSLFLIGVSLGYVAALCSCTSATPAPASRCRRRTMWWRSSRGSKIGLSPSPSPPKPVCKLEELIMAPLDLPHNGHGTMAFAFFKKDMTDKVRVEREGEQQAVQAWINLPDEERKGAYDGNNLKLPESLAAHPMTHTGPNGEIRMKELIQDRCSKCHDDEGKPGKKRLVEYEDFADVLVVPTIGHTSRQMSVENLTQTTHLHLLSFCMLWMLTGLIFAFSSCWKWVRCIVAPLALLAQIADVSCWWLARLEPGPGRYFALAIMGTGGLVALGLFLQVILSLLDMYGRAGRLVLVILFGGLIGGVIYLGPRVDAYLNLEKAASAPAAATPTPTPAPDAPAPEK